MKHLYVYRDNEIYCHHTVDEQPQPTDFPMHAHEGLEIYYFISGKGSYLVEGSRYELHPGDIMLMRPAETHKLLISGTEPYERMALHFPPALISNIDKDLLRPFYDRPLGSRNLYRCEDHPHLHTAFDNFSAFSNSIHQRSHILARLLMLLAELWDIFLPSTGTAVSTGLPVKLVSYVNEHLFEDISLQSISDEFSCSLSQITRTFRKATGSSFWEYVTVKRLLAAQAMLQRGESATRAGLACGFGDYSAFFRAYKSHFGCAPSRDKKV